jgi:hypothetical protein
LKDEPEREEEALRETLRRRIAHPRQNVVKTLED